ncbi:MAG: phosphoadenylyl-sulfate reductase [Polyangiaceae bacterium]
MDQRGHAHGVRLVSEERSPEDTLAIALERYPNIAISFSGAEDVVLIDMATRIRPDVAVFSLDTGRLHPETYRFIEKVRERYKITIELLSPEIIAVERLVREKGLFSFYKDGHGECCGIRKVTSLRRKLGTIDAWITGQRRDQSPNTRAQVATEEVDTAFSTPEHQVMKFNPLAQWSSAQVWDYIRDNEVPFNELNEKGFISIGCEPCTRPVLPTQHERAGRWWWEEATKKECGLHPPKHDE